MEKCKYFGIFYLGKIGQKGKTDRVSFHFKVWVPAPLQVLAIIHQYLWQRSKFTIFISTLFKNRWGLRKLLHMDIPW
jgi:hypothetical protein